MDSSDSGDDCYGNIAQKLQRMKNKYTEDKIESTNLLNESSETEEIVKKAGKAGKSESKSNPTEKGSNESGDKDDVDLIPIETIIAMSSKRMTRSTTKRSNSEVSISENSQPKTSNKRKKNSEPPSIESSVSLNDTSVDTNVERARNSNQSRGRSRGRGRGRSKGQRSVPIVANNFWNIPTYSVGNTDEYPDQSDSQQLFSSNKKTDDVIIVEDEALDENEELSVKVYWQSSEFFKFTIRRFQKIMQIFEYFSKKEDVSNDKLFFTFNDRILKPDDTPDSIGYSIAKFIDGGIVSQSVSKLVQSDSKKDKNRIKIKFQCQNVKKPFETTVSFDEKLSLAMMKCAEHFEATLDRLKFEFDGDAISGKITARELELEGGECIDVKITS